jgi:hypothetical protein
MSASDDRPRPPLVPTVEISLAGWALMASALAELVFNRIFTTLGLYDYVGTSGVVSYFARFGQFTMNATGIMALIIACILLPRLSGNVRFSALPARILFMLASPLYLPVVCVAVFRPVSTVLVLGSYLAATCTIAFLTVLVALNRIDGGRRRIIIAFALIQLLAAFELLASSRLEGWSHKAYMFAEALFIATPVFSFFVFLPGPIPAFLKRPHLPGLLFGLIIVAVGFVIAYLAMGKTMLTLILVAFRSIGITLAVPGGLPLYLVALFFGAFIVGTLMLPSRRWPPTPDSRRAGIGLTCIWTAGIQPTHPYQVILVFVGFLYLACSMVPKHA